MQRSTVIPAHNEAADLMACVAQFVQSPPTEAAEDLKEIILGENGSIDGMLDICRRLRLNFPDLVRRCTAHRPQLTNKVNTRGIWLTSYRCSRLASPPQRAANFALRESARREVP